MKLINIYSNKNFLLEIENNTYLIDDTNHLEICDVNNSSILIKVYPINATKLSIPYVIKLDIKNNMVFCKSEMVKVYNLKNSCDIFIDSFNIFSQICILTKSVVVKNIKYLIYCYEDRVVVSSNKGEFVYEIEYKNFEISKNFEYIYILCKNDNEKCLLVFDTNKNIFYDIKGESIEITSKSIKSLVDMNDCFGHYKVCTYNIDGEIKHEKTEMYSKQNKNISFNSNLVPQKFFEAVKARNFELARTFLCNNLNKSLKNDVLEGFVGNYEFCVLKNLNPLCYCLYFLDYAKQLTILMNGNVIEDIDML